MVRVLCPRCLELVQMEEEPIAGTSMRCPVCGGAMDPASQETDTHAGYEVHTQREKDKAPQPEGIQEYVQSLEKRARQERKRQPYHRGGFPVNLVAGLVLIICGFLLLLLAAFRGEAAPMSTLINLILPAVMLFVIGGVCLVYWAR